MARLREKSKMDLDAQTTLNQQKNKRQELMVCWFPHGCLWAVYLVVFGASESFRVFQEPLMVDTSPSGKAFLFHRQILINLIMGLINRTWNSHRYALNDSINISLLIPLYPSHHTWCQFALSTRKTCRPHGTSRASDCPSCGTGCGDAVPHLYPHCWNLNATHWGIGTGPQLDSSQLNMLHALQKLGWQMGFIDRNDFMATQISYPYICHSTSVWFFIVFLLQLLPAKTCLSTVSRHHGLLFITLPWRGGRFCRWGLYEVLLIRSCRSGHWRWKCSAIMCGCDQLMNLQHINL